MDKLIYVVWNHEGVIDRAFLNETHAEKYTKEIGGTMRPMEYE